MDLVTQGLLGGAVGQIGFQQKLGRRAVIAGMMIGLLPDFDVIWAKLSPHPLAMELIHRGLTHGIAFAALGSLLFGLLLHAYLSPDALKVRPRLGLLFLKRRKYIQIMRLSCLKTFWISRLEQAKVWIFLSFWVLLTHPLLDLFTSYGTQLLAPFSSHRFALNAVPIIDFCYTLPLLLSVIWAFFKPKQSFIVGSITLTLTSAYLLQGLMHHEKALNIAREYSQQQSFNVLRIEAFPLIPTIFAHRLWIECKERIYLTEYSSWNGKIKPWIYIEKLEQKAEAPLTAHQKSLFETFKWYTNGIYVSTIHPVYGNCILDGRYGDLKKMPIGMFNLCITKHTQEIHRNIAYWGEHQALFVSSQPFSQIVKKIMTHIEQTLTFTFF